MKTFPLCPQYIFCIVGHLHLYRLKMNEVYLEKTQRAKIYQSNCRIWDYEILADDHYMIMSENKVNILMYNLKGQKMILQKKVWCLNERILLLSGSNLKIQSQILFRNYGTDCMSHEGGTPEEKGSLQILQFDLLTNGYHRGDQRKITSIENGPWLAPLTLVKHGDLTYVLVLDKR